VSPIQNDPERGHVRHSGGSNGHPGPDGNLPAALNHLADALNDLFEPRHVNTDSPYTQLAQAIPGTQGNNRHIPGSSPPLNLDAVDLKNDIDSKLTLWQLSKRRWRPQDTELIDTYTNDIHTWCKRIDALLNPVHTKEISAACPQCDHTHVYRYNSAGEKVRQPALQIVTTIGCTCLHCHATWTPDLYIHLCRVLGFGLPDGILQ
jgi:hypothetical protein